MKPRITLTLDSDGGFLQIYVNEAGRDLLVAELVHLSKTSDHFHFGPEYLDGEVPVRSQAYRDSEKVVEFGKVLFRPDEWDAQYYPHVLSD